MNVKSLACAAAVSLTLIGPLSAAKSKLHVQVITGSMEGFLVNSTLITGAKDAVLIDAQFTAADAQRVVDAVKASKKNLAIIYITHFHPDHYFGLNVLKAAFPTAQIIALPATVQRINDSWQSKVAAWKPQYGDAIPMKPLVPAEMQGTMLTLEDEKLEIVGGLQGDAPDNSFVWIPSLKTVVTGDIVYNGVHPWTAETTMEQRDQWMKAIDTIAKLAPVRIIPGHQIPGQAQTSASLDFMKRYLIYFDQARATSQTSDELFAKVKAKYPTLALDMILKLGAQAALPLKPAKE